MDTPEQYGEDKDEHLLESLARITSHLKRNKGESWRELLSRWEAALRKVREHRVGLPEIYLAFLLINGLKLDDSEIKVLLNYTKGDIKPIGIKAWLRKNETKDLTRRSRSTPTNPRTRRRLSRTRRTSRISMQKNRTFTQSLKAKKAVELSRGSGRYD